MFLRRSVTATADATMNFDNSDIVGRILVVDDDAGGRLLVRNILEHDGHEIMEATDGLDAIAAYQQHSPDLILMDVLMPNMDGFETCYRIKQLRGGDRTPIVFITSLEDNKAVERAFSLGADDFIPKPIHWEVLRQRVRRIVFANQARQRLEYLAYHDLLTGLPNRALFEDRFLVAVAKAEQTRLTSVLLLLDLDDFKKVNDTLGHDFGDDLLRLAADRLAVSVRETDTVARLGGDEFCVLLEGMEKQEDIAAKALCILDQLRLPLVISNKPVHVSASMGVAVYPSDGNDVGTLLKHADTAMYHAKSQGRNRYEFYTSEMTAKAVRSMELESQLRSALRRGEFFLHYQPQIELQTSQLVGAEALLRWEHPELGLVSPADFIPIAEKSGLIVPIGLWVLRAVCKQINEWRASGQTVPKVAVNVSGRQLQQLEFAYSVQDILSETGVSPMSIELELTESSIMEDTVSTVENLTRLRGTGIRLAIDDFGVGFSALNYLKRLPVHVLKIDRSFIAGIPHDQDDIAIVRTILAMAHSLDLNVVAEGVETQAQHRFLQSFDCQQAQGYLYGRPVSAEQFSQLLGEPDRSILGQAPRSHIPSMVRQRIAPSADAHKDKPPNAVPEHPVNGCGLSLKWAKTSEA